MLVQVRLLAEEAVVGSGGWDTLPIKVTRHLERLAGLKHDRHLERFLTDEEMERLASEGLAA